MPRVASHLCSVTCGVAVVLRRRVVVVPRRRGHDHLAGTRHVVRQSLTPAVVDEAIRNGVVVRGHQAGEVEGTRAADVVPEDGRRIPIDELMPVSRGIRDECRVLDDGGVDVHVRTDGLLVEGPVEAAGVVEPDAQVVRTRGLRDIRHDVPLAGEAARLAGARVLAGPHEEAVVMLGGEDHVAGADLLEERRPSIRIAALGSLAEHGREVVVGEVAPVGRLSDGGVWACHRSAACSGTTRHRDCWRTCSPSRRSPPGRRYRRHEAPSPAPSRGPNARRSPAWRPGTKQGPDAWRSIRRSADRSSGCRWYAYHGLA